MAEWRGGVEAVLEILKIVESVKVIETSSYLNYSVMAKYDEYSFKGTLSIPYKNNDVSNMLANVLAD